MKNRLAPRTGVVMTMTLPAPPGLPATGTETAIGMPRFTCGDSVLSRAHSTTLLVSSTSKPRSPLAMTAFRSESGELSVVLRRITG